MIKLSLWIALSICEAMVSQLSDVVGILDMDEFQVRKKFYCKELEIRVGDALGHSEFFNIGISWSDLSVKQFLLRNLHFKYKRPKRSLPSLIVFAIPGQIASWELSSFHHATHDSHALTQKLIILKLRRSASKGNIFICVKVFG